MAEISERPKANPSQITATFRKGVVQFRHPWFANKVIRFGVKRLIAGDQAQLLAEVQKLLDRAPRYETEAPAEIREEILQRYFAAFGDADAVPIDATAEEPVEISSVQLSIIEPGYEEAKEEVKNLRGQVEALLRATGERSAAERRTLMRVCWSRFEARFHCRAGSKGEERTHVLRRM
ncbi:MAG TPA: hypothetical protein VGP72_02480 [Planctomycetota bacterium]|jgi:hypothetical protein